MIRLVVFDLDGTLADTLPLCLTSFKAALTSYIPGITEEEIQSTFGISEEGTMNKLVPFYSAKALSDYLAIYEALHPVLCPSLFEGIADIIHWAKGSGIHLSLVTGKGPISTALSLSQFGLDNNTFDPIITGSPLRPVKVDALHGLRKAFPFIDVKEIVYVGDSISDYQSCLVSQIPFAGACWSSGSDLSAFEGLHNIPHFFDPKDLLTYFKKL